MVDAARKTVLLVDDEEAFLLSLAEGLVTLDDTLDVILATDGTMAIDMLYRCDVDLMVTDIKMPGVDGVALLERAKDRHPDMPTMVMTSVGSPEVESRVRALGISMYFEKPLNLDSFIASIRRILADENGSNSPVEREYR